MSANVPEECNQVAPARSGPKLGTLRGLTRGPAKKKQEVKPKERTYTAAVRINFDFNSVNLSKEATSTLEVLAYVIKHNKKANFLITGHTDAKGSADYNLQLSNERAEAVSMYLTKQHGIPQDRLDWLGKGENDLYDAKDPDAAKNRRVEISNIGN